MDAVEHIGSGIRRIRNLCREYKVADPPIEVAEHWFTIIFPRPGMAQRKKFRDDTPQVTPQVVKLVEMIEGEMRREDIMCSLGLKDRMHFVSSYLKPAMDEGIVEMTIPEKPRSRRQRYRLTSKGKALRNRQKGEQ